MGITISLARSEPAEDVLFPEAERSSARHAGEDGLWHAGEDGQLAIDVYETDTEVILMTAIAGVTLKQLEVFLHNDMLTVRGKRTAEIDADARTLVQECHWGSFSRSVILPTEIDAEGIAATMKEGVLTVRMPKMVRNRRIRVKEA
jgi:HSP20 family protein